MSKRVIAALLVLCAALFVFTACEEKKEPITAAEAIQIVQEDLGANGAQEPPHVHSGTFEGRECYLVYVTANGKSLAYAVDAVTGEILSITESSHSH